MKKAIILCALAIVAFASCAQSGRNTTPMTDDQIQEAIDPLFEKLADIPDSEDADEIAKNTILDFVKANKNEAGAAVLENYGPMIMTNDEFKAFVNKHKYFKSQKAVQAAIAAIDAVEATAEGKMFVDFSAEYEGTTSKLSDYVGKGKYVLVDFWASWCGPCRREIPYILAAYEKYHGDNFEVLGVATWDEPEDTRKAIEEEGLPYPQMINAQTAGSDAYGIKGIPHIILFGPDGTILKRNLRGASIEMALSEIFK